MSSRFLSVVALLALLCVPASAREIRVCADPDNLPFSNRSGEGFENRIVELVVRSLSARAIYVWWNDRRSSAVEAMNKGKCDLVPGTLAGAAGVLTTRPYMTSTYALVVRKDTHVPRGLEDPGLKAFTIGVQSVGDDAVTPPVEAMLHRGLAPNLRAYTLHGTYADPNSAGPMVAAVARGDIDAAALWGPFAGFFASRQSPSLTVIPISARSGDPAMSFDIAMATRRDDQTLRDEVDRALDEHRAEIRNLLTQYHVPLLPSGEVEP